MRRLLIPLVALFFLTVPQTAIAHRSGCHRWHSCPSDTGNYVCGDTGYCSACPDNGYCLLGKPRPVTDKLEKNKTPAGEKR